MLKRHHLLNAALAVSALADQISQVVVLKRAAQNFRRGGGALVYQNDNRQIFYNRVVGAGVD